MTTVLLTGFEPFGGDASNPSGDAVRRVYAAWNGPAELVTAILPVTFADAAPAILGLIAEHEPQIVIAAGLAGNRAAVTPERVAINLIDARMPDNADRRPVDQPVASGGPAAYFSTLPVNAIARDIGAAGIPSDVSFSAGTFVCNQVFYATMHATDGMPGVRAGFIHVPWSIEHGPDGYPALPLAEITAALDIAVRTSIHVTLDQPGRGGTLS